MIISINMYRPTACYFPIFLIVFGLIFTITCAISIFIHVKDIKNKYTYIIASILGIIITIVCFISPSVVSLANGGIYLLTEKEEDAIEVSGTIEDFAYPSQRVTTFKGKYANSSLPFGVDVVIDGETYFMPYIEGFYKEEIVVIKYLPKSKFILSIDTLD